MNGKEIQEQLDLTEWPATKKLGFLVGSLTRYYAHITMEFIGGFKEGFSDADAKALADAMTTVKPTEETEH